MQISPFRPPPWKRAGGRVPTSGEPSGIVSDGVCARGGKASKQKDGSPHTGGEQAAGCVQHGRLGRDPAAPDRRARKSGEAPIRKSQCEMENGSAGVWALGSDLGNYVTCSARFFCDMFFFIFVLFFGWNLLHKH